MPEPNEFEDDEIKEDNKALNDQMIIFKLFRLCFDITSIRFFDLKTYMISVHKKT